MENSPLISWILHRPACLWSGWLPKACLKGSTQLRVMSGHTEYYSGRYSHLVSFAVCCPLWALGFWTVHLSVPSAAPKPEWMKCHLECAQSSQVLLLLQQVPLDVLFTGVSSSVVSPLPVWQLEPWFGPVTAQHNSASGSLELSIHLLIEWMNKEMENEP